MTHRSAHFGQRALSVGGALLLVAAGMLVPVGSAAAAPAASEHHTSAQDTHEVGQFNLWGSVAHYGRTEGLVPAVGDSVRDREPLALSMQEACENQVEALADDLDGYGYVFEPAWAEQAGAGDVRDPVRCRDVPGEEVDGERPRYGNAVLFREDGGFAGQDDPEVGRFDLGSFDVGEYRSMVCTPSEDLDLAVCSTHLSAGDNPDLRETEVQEAADRIQEHYGDGSVILGADLNMQPDDPATDYLYHPDYDHPEWTEYPGEGHLRTLMSECGDRMDAECREGAPTFGAVDSTTRQRTGSPDRQIDHLFASTDVSVVVNQVSNPAQNCDNPVHGVDHEDVPDELAEQETISCSDHELLWAEAALQES